MKLNLESCSETNDFPPGHRQGRIFIVGCDQPAKECPQPYRPPLLQLMDRIRFERLLVIYGLQLIADEIIEARERVELLQSRVKGQGQEQETTCKRKIRRPAAQIQRKYSCKDCGKLYGSSISLNLHKRLKHKTIQSL